MTSEHILETYEVAALDVENRISQGTQTVAGV